MTSSKALIPANLMPVREAASLAGRSVTLITDYFHPNAEHWRSYKLGGRLYVDRTEFAEFLKQDLELRSEKETRRQDRAFARAKLVN